MYSYEDRMKAVIELCTREGAASSVAEQLGTSRENLYRLKKKLLGERDTKAMRESSGRATPKDRDAMLAELKSLEKQIYQKQLELDILTKAVEIKKRRGHRSSGADEQGESRDDRCPESEVSAE